MIKRKKLIANIFAFLAALLFAINFPFSKILLKEIPATMLAALLYLGAGFGIAIMGIVTNFFVKKNKEQSLVKKDLPYVIGMVLLDIAAPILLLLGMRITSAANISLLSNFEIVATSIIALVIYKENIVKKVWFGIGLITFASVLLSFENGKSFSFSWGSFMVILACVCWGFENNCTRQISSKNPMQIVVIKGIFSGTGALIIACICNQHITNYLYIIPALILGFVAYGLSIFFYIYGQRELGAAKTSAYYAVAPFIGVGLSMIILKELPGANFYIALIIMSIGIIYISKSD